MIVLVDGRVVSDPPRWGDCLLGAPHDLAGRRCCMWRAVDHDGAHVFGLNLP